ncbi:cysteine desulfurase [Candidatus Saccharibacteria bacterium]|nr:cysteine desulfurase [Candidatus Saccharibacteria bacterium]
MIYLDHAAATPVSRKAEIAMRDYFSAQFFNPSAPYLPAKHVRDNYEFAKNRIAHTIGAKGADLIITAGATESINLAFTAVLNLPVLNPSALNLPKTDAPEILILETEHASVRAAAKHYAEISGAKLTEINVDKTGLIDLKDFRKKINKNTVFVSISLANNELGTIQPLAEIAEIIRDERDQRLQAHLKSSNAKDDAPLPLFLHSDASQALNLIDISVSRLGVNLLTINSAKIGGPKGVGALYVDHDVKLSPIIYGGGQEAGLRSGTENVPAVIGFAEAAEEAKAHIKSNYKKYQELSSILKAELKKCKVLEPIFLGNLKHQLANFCPVSFPGVDAERLIYKLEEKQVYLSTGAACSANKGTVSHVLKAIKLSDAEIAGSLRISLGVLNTRENVKEAGKLIREAVEEEYARTSS